MISQYILVVTFVFIYYKAIYFTPSGTGTMGHGEHVPLLFQTGWARWAHYGTEGPFDWTINESVDW